MRAKYEASSGQLSSESEKVFCRAKAQESLQRRNRVFCRRLGACPGYRAGSACIRHSELGGPPDRRIDCARIPSGTYAVLVFRSHAVWNCADTECRRCAQDGSCAIGEFVGTLNRRFTFHRFESVEGSRLLQRRDGGRNSWSTGESEWPACRCAAIFLLVQGQRNRAQRNRAQAKRRACA